MKTLKLSSAVRPLADYVADLRDDTVVLTKGNRAVAALIPLGDIVREALALSEHPAFLELIERSRTEFAAGRTVSLDEMKHRISPGSSKKRAARRSASGVTSRKSGRTAAGKRTRR